MGHFGDDCNPSVSVSCYLYWRPQIFRDTYLYFQFMSSFTHHFRCLCLSVARWSFLWTWSDINTCSRYISWVKSYVAVIAMWHIHSVPFATCVCLRCTLFCQYLPTNSRLILSLFCDIINDVRLPHNGWVVTFVISNFVGTQLAHHFVHFSPLPLYQFRAGSLHESQYANPPLRLSYT